MGHFWLNNGKNETFFALFQNMAYFIKKMGHFFRKYGTFFSETWDILVKAWDIFLYESKIPTMPESQWIAIIQ